MNEKHETINFKKRLISINNDDGSKCWIAKHVCEIFGIENADQVIADLDPKEKSVIESEDIKALFEANQDGLNDSAPKKFTVVNEYGFATLMYFSQTEFAKVARRFFIDKVCNGLPNLFKFAPLSFYLSDEGVRK